jgi:hypothetical protein
MLSILRGSKAATSRRGKEPAARLTREKAKSHSSTRAQASKPHRSRKRPATTRTDDDNSSADESDSEPQVSHCRKKAKHSNKTWTVEEVDEHEPDTEEVDEGELEDNESMDNPDKGKEDEVQSSNHIHKFCSYLTSWQGDNGLQKQHEIEIGLLQPVKKDSMKDLLTVFSDILDVKFKKGDGYQKLRGRWCMLCK